MSNSEPSTGPASARRLQRLAWLLDARFRVPGTQMRFGIDALLGLLPGIGDAAGASISGYIVAEAVRLGVSRATLARMLFNVALEALVGLVPVIGDLFDIGWKANLRNVRLLDAYLQTPSAVEASTRRRIWLAVAAVVLTVFGSIAVGVVAAVALVRALF